MKYTREHTAVCVCALYLSGAEPVHYVKKPNPFEYAGMPCWLGQSRADNPANLSDDGTEFIHHTHAQKYKNK
jgi:hypothetical protein